MSTTDRGAGVSDVARRPGACGQHAGRRRTVGPAPASRSARRRRGRRRDGRAVRRARRAARRRWQRVADSPLIGRPAPEATGTLDDGTSFDLSRRKGSWVVLNFFDPTCVPCIQEHPELVDVLRGPGHARQRRRRALLGDHTWRAGRDRRVLRRATAATGRRSTPRPTSSRSRSASRRSPRPGSSTRAASCSCGSSRRSPPSSSTRSCSSTASST